MNAKQKILIARYNYHNERAMKAASIAYLNERDVMIHSRIMEEIQAIYYLLFKRNILGDITMNGEI